MRCMKRLGILLLAALLLCFAHAAAANKQQEQLVLYFIPSGEALDDVPLINQKLNEYLADTLGISVKLVLPSRNNYVQTIQSELALGSQIDIAFCNDQSYLNEWVQNGWLHPLDELLRTEGQDISDWIEDQYMYRKNDVIYGVGNNVERGRSMGFEYNKDIADQYGIDMSGVRTIADLTQVFEQVQQRCEGIVPTVVDYRYLHSVDVLGNVYGVLMEPDDTVIQNPFETERFWGFLDRVYEWTNSGYTYDLFTDKNLLLYYMRSGKIFGAICKGKPGFVEQESYLTGQNIGYIELIPYTIYSSAIASPYCYIIPKTSRNPEAAMKLLNALYTDPYISNLLIYGIEGLHYQKMTDYSVQKNQDSRYCGINGYTYCNQYTAYTFYGASETLWQEMIEADQQAQRSKGYGFRFDVRPVYSQIVRCDTVYHQYIDLLFSGSIDPQLLRQEFLAALRQAGIDDIVAEKQRQFDIFLAEGTSF